MVQSDQSVFLKGTLRYTFEPPHEKTNNVVFEQVSTQTGLGCTATEDSWRLEISDLRRGIILFE